MDDKIDNYIGELQKGVNVAGLNYETEKYFSEKGTDLFFENV